MKVMLSKIHLCLIALLSSFVLFVGGAGGAQDSFPAPPADAAQVYVVDGGGDQLAPVAFETGTTPLRVGEVARGDKRSYIELKGGQSATVITDAQPRFYLFVPDESGVHPPFIVRLAVKGRARRVTAMVQKGLKGFAIASEEIVKPHYRVLAREAGMLYMEIRPRAALAPGEYAVIGGDLARVATFRVVAASNR